MAKRVLELVTDDFDGTEGAVTVHFGLDGVDYEVDLNETHQQQLRDFLQAFINVGKRTSKKKRASAAKSTSHSGTGTEAEKIRAWAVENGFDVKERGVIPKHVKEAYRAAHGDSAEPQAMTGVVPPPPPTDEPENPVVPDDASGLTEPSTTA